ncbi:MAG: ArnT family glycosyltransferase [Lentimicrobium sp.]
MLKMSRPGKKFDEFAIYIIAFIALLIRFLLMGFAEETDADAVSRVFTSWEWAKDPFWYKTSVWAPFHYYLIGSGFLIWKDMILLPKVINVLLSVLMIFPFYFFTRREFNKQGALYAAIFLTISPLIFRLGFLSLAEIPGLFFLVLAMNLLSKGVREDKISFHALSGVSITIASGMRYESWLLILLFTLMLVLGKKWKESIVFFLFAMIFPVIWMVQNYLATGDPLFSFHANTDWTHKALGINDHVDFEAYLRRIWFFPFSWLIALGPVVCWLIVKHLVSLIRKFRIGSFPDLWLIPLLLFFGVMLYNSIAGNLLLHQRFTGTLIVLSLPWIAAVLKDFKMKTIRTVVISVVLTVGLSFAYTIGGSKPIPRLKNQQIKEIVTKINAATSTDTRLIVDFIGWEDTWYTGLHSGAAPANIMMFGGENLPEFPTERIEGILRPPGNVIIIVKDHSPLQNYLEEMQILASRFTEMVRHDDITVYSASSQKK